MEQVMRLTLKGNPQTIDAVQKATDMVFSALKNSNPDLSYEWDNCGYTDGVGGHHDCGVGWSPDGHYCGECNIDSCADCKISEWRQKTNPLPEDKFSITLKARIQHELRREP